MVLGWILEITWKSPKFNGAEVIMVRKPTVELFDYLERLPELYEESSYEFWNDKHISKYMLKAHLNFTEDGASRKLETIIQSVDWISKYCPDKSSLLDLGCGAGIYAEYFFQRGFEVTGVDFSERSISYAKKHARELDMSIDYLYSDYLEMEYEAQFDIVTLIYCDFGVLSPSNRKLLLAKIYKALKPGGLLFLDGFSNEFLSEFKCGISTEYCSEGFWLDKPHIVLQRNHFFCDTRNTLEQYIVLSKGICQYYNIWNQLFSKESLTKEFESIPFKSLSFFGSVSGDEFSSESKTICVVAQK